MSDLDEDLLALAGAGAGSENTSRPASRKRTNSKRRVGAAKRKRRPRDDSNDDQDSFDDDDDDQDSDAEIGNNDTVDADQKSEPIFRNKRKASTRGDSPDADRDEVEEDEEEFINPYPLQGKYKDEDDMNLIESMDEFEREQLLYERSLEMQRFEDRKFLAQRLRESKKSVEDNSTRSTVRDTKRSRLSELKKKRQEKHVRENQREHGERERSNSKSRYDDDDEIDDDDEDDAMDVDEDDDVEWATSTPAKQVSVEDINRIRIGRTLFARYCHYPEFESVAPDCFVRINIGFDKTKQREIYRLCQIKSLVEGRAYTFLNRTANTHLVVTHGAAEKIFEMSHCSDNPITEDEFETWKETTKKESLSIISKRLLESKFQQLNQMRERTLGAEELNTIIDIRQKLTANKPANAVHQKTLLNQDRTIALNKGDFDTVQDIDARIAAIDELQQSRIARTVSNTPLAQLSKVNERNRRANQDEIRKAELRSHDQRLKAMRSANSATADPFSRLKTNPRMYYDLTQAGGTAGVAESQEPDFSDDSKATTTAAVVAANQPPTAGFTSDQKLSKSALIQQPLRFIDDLIANADFALDIEFQL
ncbi:uncharacterized protein V1516DRAFT_648489 [Lipomyces oligophaga]|uniref:uncharacterized protein n=1 Tax=Lipomyces oligophaga TaxID=45792 RepID=UPI0034CF729F